MFDSIGLARFLNVVLYVNAALAIALTTSVAGWLPGMPYITQVSASVIAVSALLFLGGQTAAFPRLCSLPIVWRLFPNIDGVYEVEISSNWSIIKAREEGREPTVSPEGDVALFRRVGTARISCRLTRIDMSLSMEDNYLTSEAVTCSVRRDQGARKPVLFYVYDSHVSTPKSTDSQRHFGAARVSIPLQRCPKILEGNYWTDRNWHRGLNTAGHIRLSRI